MLTAADLIRDYRTAHPGARLSFLFFWHEGQLRADAGQTAPAIALFTQARKPAANDHEGWNLYVDGTIAFLRGNRPALQRARDTLASLPRPADFAASFRAPNGQEIRVDWPMNLNVLDGLLRCFGRDYLAAYGSACTAPIGRFSRP